MPGPAYSTPPMPRPGPLPSQAMQAMGGGGGGLDGMMSILGAMQVPEAPNIPGTQTTFPQPPMAMNPAFAQMIMQMLMQQPQQPSPLAALMGRG